MMMDQSEITMLAETARRALAEWPAAGGVLHAMELAPGAEAAAEALLAEQGWLGVLAGEELGGLGLGARAATALAAELGRALLPGAFLTRAVLLPTIAGAAPEFAPHARAALADQPVALALALSRPGAPWVVQHYRPGRPILALAPQPASLRLRWFAGAEASPRAAFDPTCPVAELAPGTPADLDLEIPLAPVQTLADLWIAAELGGLARRALELSIAQAGERQQFGEIIGRNQAIKHRIVDDFVRIENAEALVAEAAARHEAAAEEAGLSAAIARAAATEAALSATAHCIQVHGGLGFSWEHPAHLYYKRARRLAAILGSQEAVLERIGQQITQQEPDRKAG